MPVSFPIKLSIAPLAFSSLLLPNALIKSTALIPITAGNLKELTIIRSIKKLEGRTLSRQKFTRVNRPQTNDKAERVIRTLMDPCKIWTKEPERFIVDPFQYAVGLKPRLHALTRPEVHSL